MANEHRKICSTLLVIRELQIKNHNEITFHTYSDGYEKNENKNINQKRKHFFGYEETETFVHCSWGCKVVHLIWKTVWCFRKRLNIELSSEPTILNTHTHLSTSCHSDIIHNS